VGPRLPALPPCSLLCRPLPPWSRSGSLFRPLGLLLVSSSAAVFPALPSRSLFRSVSARLVRARSPRARASPRRPFFSRPVPSCRASLCTHHPLRLCSSPLVPPHAARPASRASALPCRRLPFSSSFACPCFAPPPAPSSGPVWPALVRSCCAFSHPPALLVSSPSPVLSLLCASLLLLASSSPPPVLRCLLLCAALFPSRRRPSSPSCPPDARARPLGRARPPPSVFSPRLLWSFPPSPLFFACSRPAVPVFSPGLLLRAVLFLLFSPALSPSVFVLPFQPAFFLLRSLAVPGLLTPSLLSPRFSPPVRGSPCSTSWLPSVFPRRRVFSLPSPPVPLGLPPGLLFVLRPPVLRSRPPFWGLYPRALVRFCCVPRSPSRSSVFDFLPRPPVRRPALACGPFCGSGPPLPASGSCSVALLPVPFAGASLGGVCWCARPLFSLRLLVRPPSRRRPRAFSSPCSSPAGFPLCLVLPVRGLASSRLPCPLGMAGPLSAPLPVPSCPVLALAGPRSFGSSAAPVAPSLSPLTAPPLGTPRPLFV